MAGHVLYVFLVLLGSMLTLVHGDCAPPEAVNPCRCGQTSLSCSNVTAAQLTAVFEAIKRHSGEKALETVTLTDYNMPYIPSGLFQGTNLKYLSITTSELRSFHDAYSNKSSFAGVEETMSWLTMNYYKNPDKSFDWDSLKPLKNLYNIFLSGSFAQVRNPFPLLPTVYNFWLRNTDVTYIAENAFAGLTGVREIRVTENPITAYSRNMFPRPAKNLEVFITLSDVITVLPEDYFDEMPALTYVQIPGLDHNIPPLDVKGPTNLQSSLKLTCDCRLKWLLRMRDEGKVNILHAICARPQHLSWRRVESLSDSEL